jgi:pSer/pThr/pTyr-binding forkhead associated (FHA) protein
MSDAPDALWLLEGEDDGQRFTFRIAPGAVRTVGRAPTADFIVDAPLVSRLHCRLTAYDDRVELVDLSSTNGTKVNGAIAANADLRDGDRLSVGRVDLTLKKG